MRAIFIAVGSEFLHKHKMDTNSGYVSQRLLERGILMDMKITVGDNIENLSWVVKKASKRAQLVVITGGLGPTEDDVTREAVAQALKKELVFNEEIVNSIRESFRRRGIAMPEINARQGFVIRDAQILPNSLGTAPGQYLDGPCKIVMLPGPPREMKPMFDQVFEQNIAPLSNFHVYQKILKFSGITESQLDEKIAGIYARLRNPLTTILSSPGVIEVHLLGRSKHSMEEASSATETLAEKIVDALKLYYITDKDISFQEYIVSELKEKNLTLSVAESCTGGRLGNAITDVPGSSAVFKGGIIAYSNELKMKLLAVDRKSLDKHGAVSKEVARVMAQRVREITGSDIGVSITGIAGPEGGGPGKPVGLVFFHLASESMDLGEYQIFTGGRDTVKTRSVHHALNLIRQFLLEFSNERSL